MTAPEARGNPHLEGHAAAEAVLADAMRSARLHHGWLITGSRGIGKTTLAYRFVRRLLAGPPSDASLALDPASPVFRRVAAASHGDLFTLEKTINPNTGRLRTEIVVDDARRVPDFLRRTPIEGGWRIVVVDRADELNVHAANALLKILEEPPSRAVLLLICDTPGRLLPTLRSRCRRLTLQKLAEPTVTGLLCRYLPELDTDQAARLAAIAEGSIGRALHLAEGNGVAIGALVDRVLAAGPEPALARAHAVADALARNDEGLALFMDLLRTAIAAAVRDAARGRADPDQERLLGGRPLAAWVDVWHALGQLARQTEGARLEPRQAIAAGLALLADGPPVT